MQIIVFQLTREESGEFGEVLGFAASRSTSSHGRVQANPDLYNLTAGNAITGQRS